MDELKKRPNIVFILVDDLGWRDLGCFGSPFYETPNIDRCAGEGVKFTDAYAASPVCSPTRASILTGKYPARMGLTNFIGGEAEGKLHAVACTDHLPFGEYTVARALQTAGYSTYHVGKWHLGGHPYLPENHGFDVNIGGCSWGMPNYGYFSPYNNPAMDDGPEGEYLTDRLTDEAIRLVSREPDKPFFLHLSYYTVHVPVQAKPEYVEKFSRKAEKMGLNPRRAFEVGELFPCEHKKYLRVMRRILQSDPVYAGMIFSLDENIGRLLEELKRIGKYGDTVLFFFSDNGGLSTAESSPTCNAPLSEGKGWMYEGGTRTPLFIKWTGDASSGGICQTPVISTDFYPTILEAAGLPFNSEQHCDGTSLVPLLNNPLSDLDRDALYWSYPHYSNQGGTPGCSMRCGDWKLIEFFDDGRTELYNLREDVGEERNRALEEPKRVKRMYDMLLDWRKRTGVQVPRSNERYIPWT